MIELLLCVTLVELLNTTTSCDIALTTSEERMALGANIDAQILLRGTGLEGIAATAGHSSLEELGMNTLFHIYTPHFPQELGWIQARSCRLGYT
jgi:hypothetical protein